MLRHRLLILNGVLLLALLGNHWGRQLESASVACPTFLQQLPLPFRNWSATDIALTRSEIEMLEPDAVLMRRYQSPDGRQVAELAVIAGHRKRSVHTPYVCMRGGGWEILSQHRVDLHIAGRRMRSLRAVMTKGGQRVMVTYFFTDGDYTSSSLAQFQSVELIKRLGVRVPVGALVRIIVPVQGDQNAAERLSDAFAQATLPDVLQALQNTRLHLS